MSLALAFGDGFGETWDEAVEGGGFVGFGGVGTGDVGGCDCGVEGLAVEAGEGGGVAREGAEAGEHFGSGGGGEL